MKINIVMKETGLTKKAIYYYEEVGLIAPMKAQDGNYRIYAAEDVKILLTVQALRKLDFSIKDIQQVITGEVELVPIVLKRLRNIDEELQHLSWTKEVIESLLMEKNEINEVNLKALVQKLDNETKGYACYMQKELNRILPGNLGKMFAIHYGQFLDEPLNTKEKEQAWADLIRLLDEQDDFHYPEDIRQIIEDMFGKYSEKELEALNGTTQKVTNKILEQTTVISEDDKSEIKSRIAEYEKSEAYQDFLKFQKFTMDYLVPIFKEVDVYAAILSTKYRQFYHIMHSKLNE